jgi:hypothetical protein
VNLKQEGGRRDSTGYEQRLAQETRTSFGARTLDCVSLSEGIVKPVMNRPVRTRMRGDVGRVGESPALTRLGSPLEIRCLLSLSHCPTLQ